MSGKIEVKQQASQDVDSSPVFNFIDKHLREIKWISYGIGGVAVIVIFRSVRMTQKFTHASQIPEKFMQNTTTLQGIVKHVSKEGLLHIEHIPIMEMRMLSNIRHKSGQTGYLNIRPAGITMTDNGIKWLQANTVGKHAWFQMFERYSNVLHCDIHIKTGRFFRSSICTELIERSLCKIQHFDTLPEEKAFNQYLRDLIAKEQKASRKGKGLWKEEKRRHYIWSTAAKKSSNFWNRIKELFKFRFKKRR